MSDLCILVVARKLDSEGGGSNKSLKLLLKGLSNKGHKIKLITVNSGENNIKQVYNDVEIEEQNIKRQRIRELKSVRDILADNEHFDIAHIFNPGLLPGAGLYRKTNDMPVVGRLNHYTPFCTNPDKMTEDCFMNCGITQKFAHDECEKIKKVFKMPEYISRSNIVPLLINQLDSLFALSPTVKNVFEQNGFENIYVVPNQVDPSLKLDDEHSKLVREDNIILFVGRLRKKKGVEYLIRAMEKVDTKCQLHIVGEGKERDRLSNIVEKKSIQDQIIFHGWVPNDQLPSIYRSADVFVHPGVWPEPFGRTVLEALQFDTPCIVSNVGGPPWIIDNAGLVFEPRNVQDLADQIELFFSDDDLRSNLTSKCNKRVAAFESEKVVDEIEEKYKEIIHENKCM